MVRYRSAKYLGWLLCFGVGLSLLAPIPARAGHIENALNEWRILRPDLDGRGITLDTTNTTDIGSAVNRKGGAKALVIGDIDLLLTLDAEKLVGWRDATFFLYGLGLYGGNIAEGRDAQGVSNISARNTWKLFEGWYQQNLLSEWLTARLYGLTCG